ncbi:MAG TPA: fibronectin type III domain-containing protein, partial [Spirochaetota bacterium]|nr:fibronectin type III domain-containing protein [Spirochaetota bacterium]
MKNIILCAFEYFKGFHVCFFVVMTSCFLVFSCYGPDMFDLANSDASKGSPEPPVEDVNNGNNMQVTLDSVISGYGFVKIEWIDPDTENFTSINIYDESDDSLETSVAPGVQQVTIDGLKNGTTYAFLLRVQDDAGNLGPEVRVTAIPDTTDKDYILIHNAQELNDVRNDLAADYLVVEDINLAGAYTPWVPIGNNSSPFTGTFNGNGHTIRNLKIIANHMNKGLFGYIGDGSAVVKIMDVVLTGFELTASNTSSVEYIGSIAGYCYGAIIQDCDVSGNISVEGKAYIGGITGYNSAGGIIENSESDVVIEGSYVNNNPVGGLVGGNRGLITNSVARVDIDVNTRIGTGGIAGSSVSGATITYCSVNVKKIRSNEKVGGIIGANNGVVNYCNVNSDNGSITGTKWVGGFVGTYGEGYVTGPSSVNLDLVSGSEYVGGFAGQVSVGGINDSISIKVGKVKGAAYVGGFAGQIGSDTSLSPVFVSVDDVSVQADVEFGGSSSVSDTDNGIGGFAGYITKTDNCLISGSSFIGSVTAPTKDNVGGFIGKTYKSTVTIEKSRVKSGPIEGKDNVGGFFGFVTTEGADTDLKVKTCYSNSNISGKDYVGGFVGNIGKEDAFVLKITFNDTASYGTVVGGSASTVGGFAGSMAGCGGDSKITRAYSRAEVDGFTMV